MHSGCRTAVNEAFCGCLLDPIGIPGRVTLAILSALHFSAPAMADRMISESSVLNFAAHARQNDCSSGCTFGDFVYGAVPGSNAHQEIGSRELFIVEDRSQLCGSGGCPTALIAVGDDDVHYLADGLGPLTLRSGLTTRT